MSYPNLNAEMARKNIKILDLMNATKKSRPGVSNNLNGRGRFSIDEAFAIRDSLFPDLTIDYLFATDDDPLPAVSDG